MNSTSSYIKFFFKLASKKALYKKLLMKFYKEYIASIVCELTEHQFGKEKFSWSGFFKACERCGKEEQYTPPAKKKSKQ